MVYPKITIDSVINYIYVGASRINKRSSNTSGAGGGGGKSPENVINTSLGLTTTTLISEFTRLRGLSGLSSQYCCLFRYFNVFGYNKSFSLQQAQSAHVHCKSVSSWLLAYGSLSEQNLSREKKCLFYKPPVHSILAWTESESVFHTHNSVEGWRDWHISREWKFTT